MLLLPVALHDDPCFTPAEKPLHVQAFITESPDATLDSVVLPRLARRDNKGVDAVDREPCPDRLDHEFWAIVAANVARHAVELDEAHEHLDDLLGGDAAANLDGQTEPAILVYYHEACEALSMSAPSVHDIIGPHLMRPRGLWQMSRWQAAPFPAVPCVHSHAVCSPEALNPLMIHPHALPLQHGPDAPIAIARVALG
jgi:hypothetical protein